MEIFIVEDNPIKANDVMSALETAFPGCTIDRARALDSSKEMILERAKHDGFYDVIISDMWFPEEDYGPEIPELGFTFIHWLEECNFQVPVIICSTVQYSMKTDSIIGAVHYADKTDLVKEFKTLIELTSQYKGDNS